MTVLCEPLRHRGKIVAVVQCYNKQPDADEAEYLAAHLHGEVTPKDFSTVDQRITRMLCEHMVRINS